MLAFYFLAAVAIWLGILSLRGGFAFASYVKRELSQHSSEFTPSATVFAPCRGLEQGLGENLLALFNQDYPQYEIIFVTDDETDASVRVIKKLSADRNAKLVIAGPAIDSGQKVHNLRVAVDSAGAQSEVFVFVDTDARPQRDWLRKLVAPLSNKELGAATGYRWFIPSRLSLSSQLRAVWNASIASALGGNDQENFCWGGSTAIRRSVFEQLRIKDVWRGTVSDDFALTNALHQARLPIHFVPACLVPATDTCSFDELIEFTNRQLKITRVYAAHLWKPVLFGSVFFCLIFFGGIILAIARVIQGQSVAVLNSLLFIMFALGAVKSHVRMMAVMQALPDYRKQLRRSWIFHLLLWPFTAALYSWNAINAGFSRRIQWRGITYELKSPSEAVIIRREDA